MVLPIVSLVLIHLIKMVSLNESIDILLILVLPCYQSSMPLNFWDESFATAVYLINRLPNTVFHEVSPLEALFKVKPVYSSLRVFDCKCFPCLRPYNSHKLSFHSASCTFLGYNLSHKGYRYLESDGRIIISRHVAFDESTFPFSITPLPSLPPSLPSTSIFPLPPIIYAPSLSDFLASTQPTSELPSVSTPSSATDCSSDFPMVSNSSLIIPTIDPPVAIHNAHPMVTRGKRGIFKPKVFLTDFTTSNLQISRMP